MPTTIDRRGYTLAEAVVALLVASLLIVGLAAVLALVGRVALVHSNAAAAAETERTVATILGAELRTLTAADASFGGDTVRLRAFRGGGVVCDRDGRELTLDYAGVRRPEVDKDSVLVIREDTEAVYDLDAVLSGTTCGAADGVRLVVAGSDDSDPPPVFALVFETGTYSISGAALRYRRGAAGRQPLTEENLSNTSRLEAHPTADGSAVARIALEPAAVDGVLEWALRLPQGARTPVTHAP